jgi:alpha-beta hydrolase superfamily lysophospholipase
MRRKEALCMAAFTKESIHFPSADGKTQVAGFFYTPNEPKAVIQLSHGMCEYIERYEDMIEVLTAAGFAVCGNDHLGHGSTSPGSYGFMAEKNGYQLVLKDLYTMNTLGHEKYPGLPYFLLGHSMGSFYARWFAEKYPDSLDGLVISGTGGPSGLMPVGKALSSLLSILRGPKYVSMFMVKCSMGSYCKKIENPTSGNAWLSRDPAIWDKYADDERCNFPFTVSAYRDMLTAYIHVNREAWAQGLQKDLPIYIYSGEDDPVGDYGKGVRAVYELLQQAGLFDVTLRLYPGGRHEMHNEINKEEVFSELISWLEAHLPA